MSDDPRFDGMNTNPPKTLDYERLAEATDKVTEWEVEGKSTEEIAKLADFDAVFELAVQRVRDTKGQWSKPVPDAREITDNFAQVWSEGFMHGVVFHEEKKMMAIFGMPDANLIRGAGHKIRGWEDRMLEWGKRADVKTVGHVAAVRSVQATQILHDQEVTPHNLRTVQASHWADGWLMGYLFQDLGGHRED